MATASGEELFETFDQGGVFLGTAPRSQVHAKGLWHKSVNVFLFDGAGRLWIQRRTAWKDVCGGCWDLSVAEHLQPGESWQDGALRGLAEELGVPAIDLTPLGGIRRKRFDQPERGIFDHELNQLYRGAWTGAVSPDPAEVDEVLAIELAELADRVRESPAEFTPWLLEDLSGILELR